MNRILSEESRRILEKALDYTPENRALIYAIKRVSLLGRVWDIDPSYYASREGIAKQLDKFILPDGILYYFVVENNKPDLQRICVTRKFV